MARSGKEWIIAALIRALRTMAQTALSMLTIGMAISDVDWLKLLSVSIVAGVISILTSFATGLPEATTDGDAILTTENEEGSVVMGVKLDKEMSEDYLNELKGRKTLTLRIK